MRRTTPSFIAIIGGFALACYGCEASSPRSVNSIDDLRQFLVGNWCVVLKMPFGDNVIWKVTVSADGSYLHYSRRASALDWNNDVKKGKFTFKAGRYSNTGEPYFAAQGSEGGISLVVDAGDSMVSFRELQSIHGYISRNNCGKYE